MKNLIVGNGQIGKALFYIFSAYHDTRIRDVEPIGLPAGWEPEILHIAYPYSLGFERSVKDYIAQYAPDLTIIHSTVPVGTTDAISQGIEPIVHSPERGRYPRLASEMRMFPKYIGGPAVPMALASDFFRACEWQTVEIESASYTEFIKLVSNAHMALEVAWRQEIERMMQRHRIDRLVYEQWEQDYYHGYIACQDEHLLRPRMNPGPIGGHCLLPSVKMLEKTTPSSFLDLIEISDNKAKKEAYSKGEEIRKTG